MLGLQFQHYSITSKYLDSFLTYCIERGDSNDCAAFSFAHLSPVSAISDAWNAKIY
jgi:hypothetical protein